MLSMGETEAEAEEIMCDSMKRYRKAQKEQGLYKEESVGNDR